MENKKQVSAWGVFFVGLGLISFGMLFTMLIITAFIGIPMMILGVFICFMSPLIGISNMKKGNHAK